MTDTTRMTPDEQDKANKETIDKLLKLQETIQRMGMEWTEELQRKATTTFRDLKYMTWLTFLLGLILIAASLSLYILQDRSLQALGLGTLGVADWLALFIYKPMDRLQRANADFAQQIIIIKSWALTINLELLAMDIKKPETVTTASKNITTQTTRAAKAIQEFIEQTQQTTAEKTAKSKGQS